MFKMYNFNRYSSSWVEVFLAFVKPSDLRLFLPVFHAIVWNKCSAMCERSRIKFRGDRDVLSAPQVRKQQYELRSRFACFDVVPMVRVPINPRWLESPTREVTWGDSPSLRYEFHNASWRWGFQEQGGEAGGGGSGGFVFCESCSLACDRHTALLLTPS